MPKVGYVDHQREAERIISARARRETLMPITDTQEMSMADAYDIQRRMTAVRLARGERIAGWKLGYTSKAMRSQMGIDQPNFGPLTDQMVLDSGALLPGTVLQPKVEPEVALRFARPLTTSENGECTIDDVLDATDTAH